MRGETDKKKIESFLSRLGARVGGSGRVYLTGGGTAVLYGWRERTIDLDLSAAPEPPGVFEAIAELKDAVDINVELASPDDFIPELPGWRERSAFIARHGRVDFFHYDFYSQALAKIERGHERDLQDIRAMIERRLIERKSLWELFLRIEDRLIRYPAIDAGTFRAAVVDIYAARTRKIPEGIMNSEANEKTVPSIDDLPGADLIEQGLADVRAGRLTVPACLIFIASPRLSRAGLLTTDLAARAVKEPELTLYRLLRKEPGDAYSRYNALLRRLVSFERALDKRVGALGREKGVET